MISHAHFDHSQGLSEFHWAKEKSTLVVTPEVLKDLDEQGRFINDSRTKFDLRTIGAFEKVSAGPFTISYFPVNHTITTYGVLVEINNKRIVYTSDTSNELLSKTKELMRGADVVIINTVTFHPPKPDHITVVEAVELLKDLCVGRAYLSHINHTNKPHDELEKYLRENSNNVFAAYDGLRISV